MTCNRTGRSGCSGLATFVLMICTPLSAAWALPNAAFLHEGWAINHATLEPEVVGCASTELLGRWDSGCPNPSPRQHR